MAILTPHFGPRAGVLTLILRGVGIFRLILIENFSPALGILTYFQVPVFFLSLSQQVEHF